VIELEGGKWRPAIFLRVKERGEHGGFPRFKSLEAFLVFDFENHDDGWRYTPGADGKQGKLRLQGIGIVKNVTRGTAHMAWLVRSSDRLHLNLGPG